MPEGGPRPEVGAVAPDRPTAPGGTAAGRRGGDVGWDDEDSVPVGEGRPWLEAAAAVAVLAGIVLLGWWIVRSVHTTRLVPCGSGDGDLLQAAAAGDEGAVRAALDGGADLNGRGPSGRTPLTCAAAARQPATVATLLDRGADANAVDGDADTALAEVVDARGLTARSVLLATTARLAPDRRDAVLAALLAHGARPGSLDLLTPAVRDGDHRLLHVLLDGGVRHDVDAALATAAGGLDEVAVTDLLDHDADADRADALAVVAGKGPADLLWQRVAAGDAPPVGARASMVRLLVAHGAHPDGDGRHPTPLTVAAFTGVDEVAGPLLDAGADPDAGGLVDRDLVEAAAGTTPSALPFLGGTVPMAVAETLGTDARPPGPTLDDLLPGAELPGPVPPVAAAAAKGDVAFLTLLLDHGADPDAPTLGRYTPLHAAALSSRPDAARLLLARGAHRPDPSSSGAAATVPPGPPATGGAATTPPRPVPTPADVALALGHTDTALALAGAAPGASPPGGR